MTFAPAIDGYTLAFGGNTVRLRPSLRAASRLERLHDGFATLFRHVDEFRLGTIREIILATADDQDAADRFLSAADGKPFIEFIVATKATLADLCRAFVPASDEKASAKPSGKPMPWPAVYREFFRTATGWLGWTPDAAWRATPTEITEAFEGLSRKLDHVAYNSIFKQADKPADQANAYTPDQLRQIEEQGFDPAFDRQALQALKAKLRKPSE